MIISDKPTPKGEMFCIGGPGDEKCVTCLSPWLKWPVYKPQPVAAFSAINQPIELSGCEIVHYRRQHFVVFGSNLYAFVVEGYDPNLALYDLVALSFPLGTTIRDEIQKGLVPDDNVRRLAGRLLCAWVEFVLAILD